jgi:hypothetical protein
MVLMMVFADVTPHQPSYDSDENGRKRTEKTIFLLPFLYFLAKTGSGSENMGSKTESEYADIRKRTNTDGEPEN